MRSVFFGTSDFAATVLRRLAASEHRPQLVITPPDRPRGRGRRLGSPPAAEAARELGIELAQPHSVNEPEALERIAAAEPEAVCICAFGGLIKEPLLSAYEMLNVHPSLLPRWRGAAPIERAIEAGDPETGVSIMRPTAELDAGPVFVQRSEPLRPDDDFGSLAARLATLGGELLVEALDRRAEPRGQDDADATYAEKIEAADRFLEPSLPAERLERRVRALTPHVGAFVTLPSGERLRVRRARLAPPEAAPEPGRLVAADERLYYGATPGALELLELQPAGGRPMEAAAWLRGHRGALSRSDAGGTIPGVG